MIVFLILMNLRKIQYFLKVYAFDVTDLDQKEYNIYFETDDYDR